MQSYKKRKKHFNKIMAASKTSPLWIENEVQKCFQQSENMETFEIAIAILSGKLQFIRDSIFNSKKSVIYLTPKKRKFEVIFRRLEPEMIVSCYGKRRKVLDEIYEIACSTKLDSLCNYMRLCQAKDGEDLMQWCLKNPSKEIRLHIWELLKEDANEPVDFLNNCLNDYI